MISPLLKTAFVSFAIFSSSIALATDAPEATSSDFVFSDVLIALDSDGRSHTVQHTVATSGAALTLTLPGSVIPQQLQVLHSNGNGPVDNNAEGDVAEDTGSSGKVLDASGYADANTAAPTPGNQLLINNGAGFARYQHQYGTAVIRNSLGQFELSAASIPQNINLETDRLVESTTTWVFPAELEVVSYTAVDPNTGTWIYENNTLSFFQKSTEAVMLKIAYRNRDTQPNDSADLCAPNAPPNDTCSPDTDVDGVPDYRDVCPNEQTVAANELGCDTNSTIRLTDIVFASGHSYLDLKARQLLDRVAYAMRNEPTVYYEIGAHTDNGGRAELNLQLSQKRADAVRHYLMLRGVGPNQIRATGYGESYPIRDNGSADGRRANRRIEITLLN